MLILKVFINENKIDEIWIHNVGRVNVDTDTYEYRIRKPEGYDHIPIYHSRNTGWTPLTIQVLALLEREGV